MSRLLRGIGFNLKSLFLVAFICLLLVALFSKANYTHANMDSTKNFVCITIDEDDTLWSIADRYITSEYSSIDSYIDEIISINNLDSTKIYSGATLVVPYYVSNN